MRKSIATHERLSDQLREDKKAVPPMLALARKQLERDELALTQLQKRRNTQLETEATRETELVDKSKKARGQAADRLQDVETEEGVRKSLHLDHILDWASALFARNMRRGASFGWGRCAYLVASDSMDLPPWAGDYQDL